MMKKTFYLLSILTTCFTLPLEATVYFVDSQNGSDQANGTVESQAWQSLEKVNTTEFKPGDVVRFIRGGLWRGTLNPKSGTADAPITYTCYGSDDLPKPRIYGSKSLNRSDDWVKIDTQLWRTAEPVTESLPGSVFLSDVGNLIFDGKRAGVKCWKKEQLTKEWRFWFDYETRYVWLVSVDNPAENCHELEAALRRDPVVNLIRVDHVVISDFDVRYGAANGFGGAANSYITIRDCDISWIGGGHMSNSTRANHPAIYDDIEMFVSGGVAVRFGNGIEFWRNAHDILVDGCRIWEVYDSGISNQGTDCIQRNITYRNNIIWNCENLYEYWSGGAESIADNIVFTHNTCINAGYGWGHTQRPNPNGCHILTYITHAQTTNFIIKNNVFAYATEYIIRIGNSDWGKKNLQMDDNIWFQQPDDGRTLVMWQGEKIDNFRNYQEKTGLDRNSLLNESGLTVGNIQKLDTILSAQISHVMPELAGMDSHRLAYADSAILRSIAAGETPGAVLAIVRFGKLAYLKAFGNKQVYPTQLPMTENTVFDMASVSKVISTAISIMILVERGQLQLSDDVSHYIPCFQPWVDGTTKQKTEINLIHLLTHTSGLPAHPSNVELQKLRATPTRDAMIDYISKTQRLWSPGTQFGYSCQNFIILGYIVELISGKSLQEFARENIFEPLGMKHTDYNPTGETLERAAPTDVTGIVNDYRARLMGGVLGNAGVFSDAEDLAILCAMLLNDGELNGKRILSPLTVKVMCSIPEGFETFGRTLGWNISSSSPSHKGDLFSSSMYGHTGSTGTSLAVDTETQTAIILLTNRVHLKTGDVTHLRDVVANAVAGAICRIE